MVVLVLMVACDSEMANVEVEVQGRKGARSARGCGRVRLVVICSDEGEHSKLIATENVAGTVCGGPFLRPTKRR